MSGCPVLTLWVGRAKQMARKRRATKKSAKSSAGTKIRRKRQRRKEKAMVVRSDYAKLIMDPCMGPLVRAVGGDTGSNIVERVRWTSGFPLTAANARVS